MPWRDLPKGGAVDVIPDCSAISFWTFVKTLPAAGAHEGCQAGWARWVCPQTASQSLSGEEWSTSTSPWLVRSRGRRVVSSLCGLLCPASLRRGERLAGFGARACSYSNAGINFICTQSQHVGGLEGGRMDSPWGDTLPPRDSPGF